MAEGAPKSAETFTFNGGQLNTWVRLGGSLKTPPRINATDVIARDAKRRNVRFRDCHQEKVSHPTRSTTRRPLALRGQARSYFYVFRGNAFFAMASRPSDRVPQSCRSILGQEMRLPSYELYQSLQSVLGASMFSCILLSDLPVPVNVFFNRNYVKKNVICYFPLAGALPRWNQGVLGCSVNQSINHSFSFAQRWHNVETKTRVKCFLTASTKVQIPVNEWQ